MSKAERDDDARSIIEEATRTRVLELSYRSLPVAPTYITAVNTLTRLDLSHNCLEYLPEDLGKLTNLRELWLSHNNLQELPQSIGSLLKLKSLDLQYNQLNMLPETIGRLLQLVDLDLRNNPLNPKLAKRLFKKGEGRIIVMELRKDMYNCVLEDLLDIVMQIGQHRFNEEAKTLTDQLVDEFGGSTAALSKLVRNAYTLVPRNLKEADAALIKRMFDARFQEAKGAQSLSSRKKITCGFPWIPTGTGTLKRGTYGDEYWHPDGIW